MTRTLEWRTLSVHYAFPNYHIFIWVLHDLPCKKLEIYAIFLCCGQFLYPALYENYISWNDILSLTLNHLIRLIIIVFILCDINMYCHYNGCRPTSGKPCGWDQLKITGNWDVKFQFKISLIKYSLDILWCNLIRADSRFVPSQWKTSLLCNDIPHWLGASLESALLIHVLIDSWRHHQMETFSPSVALCAGCFLWSAPE